MAAPYSKPTAERERQPLNGWLALLLVVLWFVAAVALFVSTAAQLDDAVPPVAAARILGAFLMVGLGIFLCFGFFTLEPNEARVLILFGDYKGTARRSGFLWANPLYARNRGVVPGSTPVAKKVKLGPVSVSDGTVTQPKLRTKLSLRAHNFNSETLKVNDKRGNPVEIAAVVVWRVEDTAQAVFDVEDYESYVQVQSESAIRSIASLYAYDHGEEHEPTLRGGGDEVSLELKKELEVRLAKAGVVVEEARLTHLAYAPEIAPAMLRRQQAEAVIAAREKIVLGAVSMVEMALNELAKKNVVTLDEERKAAMVSNLLVVLCGTEEASPVINTGTLYT
ncbi:MAG TPA: SPFH domain-containing protein [Gammaproteobacteria bacterium]|nr:SPFH domain-containing protein [Gammaproteobacteria bacterium]